MAWGLAEFDAERRGYKEGVAVGVAQGLQQGISQGSQQKAIETAKNLLLKNISVDIISECTGLPVDEIKELTKKIKKN